MLRALALVLLLVPVADEADVWKALDDPRTPADKVKSLLGSDAARAAALLRKGRPGPAGTAGETKERVKDAFGGETDLWIVVPPTYDPSRPAGVLLLLHGLGGNGGQMKNYFQEFAAEQNYIMAAPSAQKEPDSARNEDSPGDFGGAAFPHWWVYREGGFPLAALALLKRRYAVDESRVVLSGVSMGGFGTWNIGLRTPDRFSAIVPICGGLSRLEFVGGQDGRSRKLLQNAFHVPAYFIHGDQDETVPVTFDRWSRDQLKAQGTDHVYVEVPKGRHDLRPHWPELQAGLRKWLAGKERQAHPKEVRHHAIGRYALQSFWVRVAEFSGEEAEVKAAIKDQTIDFTATGARKVTFYVDEKLLDPAKPIRVTSRGKKLYEGRVKPSVDVVLESWRAREDRELLYRASITVPVP